MKKKLQFLIVLWVILLSGSVVFMHYYNIMFYFFVLLILVYILKTGVNNIKIPYGPVLVFLIIIILGLIYNQDFSAKFSYLHIFIKILLVATIPYILSFDQFADKFLRIIFFLSLTSLMIFTLVFVNRELVSLFPEISSHTAGKAFYYNLFLAVYHVPLPNNISNSSVFWEPGAFQAFLNIAIAFELYFFKFKHKKRLIVFVLSMITTFSTTGYIIFIIQLSLFLFFDKSFRTKWSNIILKILLIGLLLMFVFSGLFIGTVLDKFSETNYSYYVRFGGTLIDLSIFSQSPLFGVGQSAYKILMEKMAYNIYGLDMGVSPNSLTQSLAIYGSFLMAFLLFYYYKFTYLIAGNNLIKRLSYSVILLIIFSTENFITSYFFLSLLIYGTRSRFHYQKLNDSLK